MSQLCALGHLSVRRGRVCATRAEILALPPAETLEGVLLPSQGVDV